MRISLLTTFLTILLFSSNSYACYIAGDNPDTAYLHTTTLKLYATPASVCNAWLPFFVGGSWFVQNITDAGISITCAFMNSDNNDQGGVSVPKVTGDTAYGSCDTELDNIASVCNDGEITSDYRDSACSDNTVFTEDGLNITSEITTDTDVETTTDTYTDENGNTVTETTTTTTDTSTDTSSAGGNVIDSTAGQTVTTDTTTTVTDPDGNIISSDSNTTTSDSDNTGTYTTSGSCDVAPSCSASTADCAIIYQIWKSACMSDESLIAPEHNSFVSTYETTADSFTGRVSNSPIMLAFDNIGSMFTSSSGTCPVFSMVMPPPINSTLTTALHCEIFDDLIPLIQGIMLVAFSFMSFRIVASA